MSGDPDKAALFERCVREHGALVARIAASYEARPALVDELVQETFAALWRGLPTLRDPASARAFLARLTHNTCVTHVRRAVRRPERLLEEGEAEAVETDDPGPGHAERARLLRAVRQLALGDRQVLTMHLEGFTNAEIGDVLGLAEGTVAVRLTRARQRLRRMLLETTA